MNNKACDDATQAGVGAGNMKICAKINVQHQGLASFNNHLDLHFLCISITSIALIKRVQEIIGVPRKGKLFLHDALQAFVAALLVFQNPIAAVCAQTALQLFQQDKNRCKQLFDTIYTNTPLRNTFIIPTALTEFYSP